MPTRVNIESIAWTDPRFDLLGDAMGLDADCARGKMTRVWDLCTERMTDVLEARDVAGALTVRGVFRVAPNEVAELLGDAGCGLADVLPDGRLRIRGCEGRTDWKRKQHEGASRGGRARAIAADRNSKGHYVTSSPLPAVHQPPASGAPAHGPAAARAVQPAIAADRNSKGHYVTSSPPPAVHQPPASGAPAHGPAAARAVQPSDSDSDSDSDSPDTGSGISGAKAPSDTLGSQRATGGAAAGPSRAKEQALARIATEWLNDAKPRGKPGRRFDAGGKTVAKASRRWVRDKVTAVELTAALDLRLQQLQTVAASKGDEHAWQEWCTPATMYNGKLDAFIERVRAGERRGETQRQPLLPDYDVLMDEGDGR